MKKKRRSQKTRKRLSFPREPAETSDLLQQAISLHQSGRLREAAQSYEKILAAEQHHPDANHLLGVIALQADRHEEAVEFISRAIRGNPNQAAYYNNLGLALLETDRIVEAMNAFEEAIRIDPKSAEAHNNLGTIMLAREEPNKAASHFMQALQSKPAFAEAHNNLGNVFIELGKQDEAIRSYEKAIRLKPDFELAHFNLGNVLREQRKFIDAAQYYRNTIQLNPQYIQAYNNLGDSLINAGREKEAEEVYLKALSMRQDHPGIYYNLGKIYTERNRMKDAEDSYEKAIGIKEDYSEAHYNLGNVLLYQGKFDRAAASYRKALDYNQDYAEAFNNLGTVYKEQGLIQKALECHSLALQKNPLSQKAQSNYLLTLHYIYGNEGDSLFEHHKAWGERYGQVPARYLRHQNKPVPDKKLRIGYVSPDFRTHSVSIFFEPILKTHNRNFFEIFNYADVHTQDRTTTRLRDLVDRWHDVTRMDDDALADLILSDRIDILVDLAGHTGKNRLKVFAIKPAPVQVTYLGYPNTTGLEAMDYRITDSWADPAGVTDRFHTEKLIRLPHGFLCYHPPENTPNAVPPPVLKSGTITFGSFNNFAKITPEMIRIWSEILKKVPSSHLILKALTLSDEGNRQRLIKLFQKYDIEASRLQLHGFTDSTFDHLSLYNHVDIALDTFPYNGTTTTCEALWMGVPVITLAGQTHVSRVGVSLLTGVGLDECIAGSGDGYREKAVRLAADLPRLQQLRNELRGRMAESPLTNAVLFTRSLEDAFREMWGTWCDKRADMP